jgi:hypothetical protein
MLVIVITDSGTTDSRSTIVPVSKDLSNTMTNEMETIIES